MTNDYNELTKKVDAGFETVNDAISTLSSLVAVLTERVENVRENQRELTDTMKELETTKKEVEKNTQFRQDALKVFWTVIGVFVTVATTAAIWGISQYIASQP